MIGILGAFMLNNWNENRKDKISEQEYLIGLKDEFEFNLLQLDKDIELNQNIIEATKSFLEYTGPTVTNLGDMEIGDHLGNILKRSVGYESNPGVLEDLISSGNLNKITNKNLRRALSVWKADLIKSAKQEYKVNGYRDIIAQLFIDDGPMRTMLADTLHIKTSKFELSAKTILQDPRLENNLSFFMITSIALKSDNYPKLKDDILTIIDLINQEIE